MACSANRNHIGAQYGVVEQPHAAISAGKSKMCVSEIASKLFKLQLEYTQNRALSIQLIEDTLLIDAGKRKFRNKKRQQRDKRKKKRCVEKKRVYSREELEALRFHNLDAQKKNWAAVYGGLRPVVAAEYDGLVDPRPDFGGKEKPSHK